MKPEERETDKADKIDQDMRREFLKKAAMYGVATPAAVTLLLSAGAKKNEAQAYV